ncbi:MAG TPA: hypothetical protein VMS89_04440 [Methanoregulaceae archaeon]|nr:hypothetical protein [Methanoregulaceae archaeon]
MYASIVQRREIHFRLGENPTRWRSTVPEETIREYAIQSDEKVILISGSKASGGFVVARRSFLEQSTLSGILSNNPELAEFRTKPGELIRYKGRLYCWGILHNGLLKLPAEIMCTFCIQPGDNLLVIRGSNLGFVCAKSGPLVKKVRSFPGIPVFE